MLEPVPTTDASSPFGSVRTGDAATAERFAAAGFVEQEYLYGGAADANGAEGGQAPAGAAAAPNATQGNEPGIRFQGQRNGGAGRRARGQ